jgi:hypothetical protein
MCVFLVEALAEQIVPDVAILNAQVTSLLQTQTAQDARQPFFLVILLFSRKPANQTALDL